MYIAVFITCANKKEAERIARGLLREKLVACANLIGSVHSMFWWRGSIDTAREVMLMAKSRKTKLNAIIRTVRRLHSYEVPEIIAVALAGASKAYLEWIDASVR